MRVEVASPFLIPRHGVPIQKTLFIAAHYAALAVFVTSCWGFGRALVRWLGAPPRRDASLEAAMAVALGIGLFIVVFQGLGIAGIFRAPAVLAMLGGGLLAAGLQARGAVREWTTGRRLRAAAPASTLGERYALLVLALVGLTTVLSPLAPPMAFDEMMYHLPYARQVAEQGRLGVYEWLRYPWFPYNYNLLYAAALMLYDDVFTHLLHALAGWVSVWMVLRIGTLHANRVIGCIGAGIWLALGDYHNAYIDMGVALFILTGCVALWWWRTLEGGTAARWLAAGGFALGVAAGSKYQALSLLPLVAVFVLRRERRIGALAIATLAFLLPCIYWYARNALQTGDPFNPIGGRLFGFTNWNMDDYRQQLDDVLRAHAEMPHAALWPVLLAPWSPLLRRSPALKAAAWFSAWSLLVWVVTSRYPRYLMASVPLIALTAAVGWHWIGVRLVALWGGRRLPAGALASRVLLVVLAGVSVVHTIRSAQAIAPSDAERQAFWRKNVPGYEVLTALRAAPTGGRLYQIALNDSLYLAPNPVWGDIFGPWRYAAYVYLSAAELAQKLRAGGFDTIVIQTSLAPYVHTKAGFDRHFTLLHEHDGVRAYRVLPAPAMP